MISMDAFRVFVIAVVGIALVAVLLQIIDVSPETNEIAAIKKQLKTAQAQQGVAVGDFLTVRQGTGISGRTFDSLDRVVGTYCNSARYCCPEGQACPNAIEWSRKGVAFKDTVRIQVNSRCSIIADTFSCTVYFGKKPAQLKIEQVSVKDAYDNRDGLPVVRVTIINEGLVPAFMPTLSAKIFVHFFQDERDMRERAAELDTRRSLPPINPGQSYTTDFALNTPQEGLFEAELVVSERQEMHWAETIRYSVFRSAGNCRADTGRVHDLVWIEGTTCGKRYYCSECEKARDCVEAWFQEKGQQLEVGTPAYAYETVSCEVG